MALDTRNIFALSLFWILFCSVDALKCTKLISIDGSTTSSDQVFSRGVYKVKTTVEAGSEEIKQLATDLLTNISTVEFKRKSFTGMLQPKHIKKVNYICHYLCTN